MLRNFIIITFRSLSTHRIYSFINVFGLAVGMACALLVAIFVLNETSYDKFYKDADQIYRVTVSGKLKGKKLNIAVTAPPMAKTLVDEYPDIKLSTRVARFGAWLVSYKDKHINEDNFLFADPNFFNMFSFKLLEGNRDSVLSKPRSIVLTQTAARKYFGDEDPVGKHLRIETDTNLYTVTGLMQDVPFNSHMHFDMLGSLVTFERHLQNIWVTHNVYTYIKVRKGCNIDSLTVAVNKLVVKYVAPQVKKYLGVPLSSFPEGKHTIKYHLQSLRSIHLYSNLDNELEPNGKALYVYSFSIIAILILLIACLNFMNLSTANSANRAREVVLRKVMGSERKLLIFQFLTESVLFSFMALLIALLIAELAMPAFNKYLSINLNFQVIKNWPAAIVIILFTFLLGIMAGNYPAFFISGYDPVKVLHGNLNKGVKNRQVRSIFVIFQFTISILIIILSMVVLAQVDYMLNKKLGFDKERIVVIRRPDALKDKIDDFKKEILKNPNIESVTNSNSIPGRDFMSSSYIFESDSVRETLLMNLIFVNYDFQDAFKLQMDKGRFFSKSVPSDSFTCVINETAARTIGQAKVIGNYLEMAGELKKYPRKFKIIGVVKDFHFETVDKPIEPLVMSLMPGNWEGYLNVRINSRGIDKSVKFLEETWKKYTSEYPFVSFFLDQDFDQNYRSVIRTGKVLIIFSVISVLVACLGLFGLVLFTSNQRTNEIGIRKAVGATFYRIIFMLLKETIRLILLSTVIAWGLAYLFSRLWLKNFYSRIQLSPRYFIFASLIVLSLSVLVVSYQCYIASRRDPGEAMKVE